mmetsp:Transcript_29085/g.71289  ORF Transcript_29085/g.71289 Transcript_29085/m.71289 type:complete len:247 (-) Transcript_29085:942-1682(-)
MGDGAEERQAMRRAQAAFDYDEERKKNERIKVQNQLEALDADKDKLHLFGRLRNEGVCMCGACDKRRYWIASRRVGKKEEEIEKQEEFDKFIQSAYKGEDEDMDYSLPPSQPHSSSHPPCIQYNLLKRAVADHPPLTVQQAFEKHGSELLSYVGGPVAITGCEQCGAVQSKDKVPNIVFPVLLCTTNALFDKLSCVEQVLSLWEGALDAIKNRFESSEKGLQQGACQAPYCGPSPRGGHGGEDARG